MISEYWSMGPHRNPSRHWNLLRTCFGRDDMTSMKSKLYFALNNSELEHRSLGTPNAFTIRHAHQRDPLLKRGKTIKTWADARTAAMCSERIEAVSVGYVSYSTIPEYTRGTAALARPPRRS